MLTTTHFLRLIASSALVLVACSQSPPENAVSSAAKAGAKTAQVSAAEEKCKEFPLPIYPSHTELSCETGSGKPLRQTAYIASADPVDKVTAYYKTQVQASGWAVEPSEVESPQHSLVRMTKGKGYATAVINIGMGNVGSRTQVHAYPNGNE